MTQPNKSPLADDVKKARLGRADNIHRRRLFLLKCLNPTVWKTPQDLGGYDSSHHSGDLQYLVKKGFAIKRRRYVGISGGSNMYQISESGQAYLKESPHEPD